VKGRHLWPGNYTGKVAFTNSSAWRTSEVLNQIRLTRAQPGASGNVHFSMKVFQENPDSLNERLARDLYSAPALVPATPWLGQGSPARPAVALLTQEASGDRVLDLRAGAEPVQAGSLAGKAAAAPRAPWLWVVQSRTEAGWMTKIVPGTERMHLLARRDAALPLEVRVMAVDRLGNMGPSAALVTRR
jgi:hypothetical protein